MKLIPELIDSYAVTVGQTIRKGMTVKITSGKALETTSTDAIGIALDAADGDDPKRDSVRVHRFGAGRVPVLCSAAITTQSFVKPATNGVASLTPGGGNVLQLCVGRLVEAGTEAGLADCDLGVAGPTVSA